MIITLVYIEPVQYISTVYTVYIYIYIEYTYISITYVYLF